MENKSAIKLGVTLYSFTNEWLLRQFDLESMVARVAELGLGPAVEVVGFQSFRTYPDVTPEFASYFRNLLDRYGLEPNCLGANVDLGIRKDRMMTTDESVDYIRRQIETAKMLGFSVVRSQTYPSTEELDRIIPIAEKAGVHVASEIHSPLNLEHPVLSMLIEYYQKIQTPALGFIPDFGATMTAPPEIYWENLRQLGAGEALIEAVKAIWKTSVPAFEKFKALADAGQEFGASPAVASLMNNAISMFGHMPVDDWRVLMPYVRHIHGKFYGVTPDGVEPSVPYPELMALLKDVGYTGTISAEWEGHAFNGAAVGFEQVSAWRSMCEGLLAGQSLG
jgi:sugar phosphate isomerase/epimerase